MIKVITSLIFLIICTSCFEAANNMQPRKTTTTSGVNGGGVSCSGGNDCVTGGGGGVTDLPESVLTVPKVEIRHLIQPKIDDTDLAGSYKRKLTLPKNYDGKLYLAGINLSSLNDKSLSVRFNFGYNSSPFEIEARVGSAPGLIDGASIGVLIMDMKSKPFENINLLYNLFDYNEYDFDGSGNDPGALSEPVSSNRDDKLYCRGLMLSHDPSFDGTVINGCKESDDVCKYAYARVVDKGLVGQTNTGLEQVIFPSEQNVQSGTSGLYDDTTSLKLNRCLPDNIADNPLQYFFDSSFTFNLDLPSSPQAAQVIDGNNYFYQGPYLPIDVSNWEISSNALKGQYGVFSEIYDDDGDNIVDSNELEYGYKSRLFPLYTKSDLPAGVEYLGSSLPNGVKVLQETTSNSESLWMDGCNERATTVHRITGENVGSCNVTATIEILARDDDGVITVVDITDEVKLQLVKPVQIDSSGNDVLLSNFQQCSSSNQCGAGSCCINERCWDKSIVGQCIEDLPSYGNQVTGSACTTDYQCSSLCCNKLDGRCAPHDPDSVNPSFCSKPSGQTCVAQEWCQKSPVTTCAIVSTGTDEFGGVTCDLRCVTAEVFGECTVSDGVSVGQCKPPCQPTAPVFNPTDPNRCEDAISFDQLVETANNPVCGASEN